MSRSLASSPDPTGLPIASLAGRLRRLRGWLPSNPLAAALLGFALLLLAGMWGATSYQIGREFSEAQRQAELNLGNLTRAFAEHSSKTIEGADQAVRFARREYLLHGAALDIRGYLDRTDIIHSAYHLLSVIGPDGYVSHSSQPFSKVDLRDREHFRVHAEGSEDRLFISKPLLGRVSKKWSIQLTRRIDAPDGRFGGVVVLSLSPSYLTDFYKSVDLGANGVITLVGFDGVVRARAAADSEEGGQDLSDAPVFRAAMAQKSGTMVASSRIDGVERLVAFQSLDEYELVVMVGKPTEALFREARERRTLYLAGSGVVTLGLLAFMAFVLRAGRRQQALMERLRQSEREANAASEMKSRFLASVSHELRTPLNGILGYAELIRDTSADAESREFGGIVHRSAEHLHSLVNTILDLAKIESGRMVLQLRPVPLVEVVDEVVRLNAVFAESRRLQLVQEIAPQAPPLLHTDRTRLVQVLGNLLSNAIKFTEHGGVTLRVRPDPGGVLIQVQDSGIGIPPEQLRTVFSRFHATMGESMHPLQGAGLGLPLARELTELLGGRLEIASVPGQGTVASVHLPLQASATAQAPGREDGAVPAVPAAA